jgi:hypothetical protein
MTGTRLEYMPRHEPAGRADAGEPPPSKVKMRLDANGRWVPVVVKAETKTATEAAERPPTPDDPRPAAFRQIPPFGGAL